MPDFDTPLGLRSSSGFEFWNINVVMDELNEKLRQLIAEVCTHPAKSLERQQKLNHVYRLVMKSGKLWKERTPYYNDALQEMWEYCCQHPEEYDSSLKQVITWLDDELKKRLRRYRYAKKKQQEREITTLPTESEKITDPVDNLRARSDIQPVLDIWSHTQNWVLTDPEGVLRRTCFRKRPEVNCQALFLQRFPAETPWNKIAESFELTSAEAKDLPKWFNRNCLPLLRKFGAEQGYIEERKLLSKTS